MDASLVQIVVAVFSAMLLQAWYLHRETRRSHEETVRLIEKSHDQLRTDHEKSHDQLRTDFAEHKTVTEGNHRETQRRLVKLGESLGDARERMARIEGYLRIGLPEPPQAPAEG